MLFPGVLIDVNMHITNYIQITGLVAFSDPSKHNETQTDYLNLAFIESNASHFAEFATRAPTPMIKYVTHMIDSKHKQAWNPYFYQVQAIMNLIFLTCGFSR